MKKRFTAAVSAIVTFMSLLPAQMPVFAANNQIDNLIAVNSGTKTLLSWKNPAGTVQSVSVADADGNTVKLDAEPDTTGNKLVSATVSGLTSGKTYDYTVTLNMEDGSEVKGDVSFLTGINYRWDAQSGIKMQDIAGCNIEPDGLRAFRVDITPEAARTGNSGMHIKSNNGGWDRVQFDGVVLDSSKKYKVSVWSKASGLTMNGTAGIGLCNDNTTMAWLNGGNSTGWSDWVKTEYTITGKTSVIVKINMNRTNAADLWLDDFGVYELDSAGNEIGENLLKNGSLEYSVSNYAYADGVVSWTEPPTTRYKGVDIYYRDPEGNKIQLNEEKIPNGTTSFALPEKYVSDESFDLLFVNYIDEHLTDPLVYSVVGKLDCYKTELKAKGTATETLKPGEITVSRMIKNGGMGNNFSATMIIGLYKNDELVTLKYKSAQIPQNNTKTEISDTITVPDDGVKYELRSFLWDSPTSMNVIKAYDSFKMN